MIDDRTLTAPPIWEHAYPAEPRPLFRGPRPGDARFIPDAWYRQLAMVDRDYSRGGKWGQAGKHIDLVLDRADTRIVVCHAPEDTDRIRAWLVHADLWGPAVVHFVFVRKPERQRGLATALLAHIGIHRDTNFVWTSPGPQAAIMQSKYQHAVRMPLARFLGVSAVP